MMQNLNVELESRTAWAREREAALAHCVDPLRAAGQIIDEREAVLARNSDELSGYPDTLPGCEASLESRTAWARERDAALTHCVDPLHAAERTIDPSRWVKIGKAVRVGPLSR